MTNNIKTRAERKTFIFLIGRIALIKACVNCQVIADEPEAASCKVCGVQLLELSSTREALTNHQSRIAAHRRQADSLTKKSDFANAFLKQQGLFDEYRVKACVPDDFGLYGTRRTLVVFRAGVALVSIMQRREEAILETVTDLVSR